MEFRVNNKKGSEPIHRKKGKLAPLAPHRSKAKIEIKSRSDYSPKYYDLPKIHALNSSELQQYMSCGGIKLGLRFNLSGERNKKKISIPVDTVSLVTIHEASTAPTCTPFFKKVARRVNFPLRRLKVLENPEERKFKSTSLNVPEKELLLNKKFKKQPFAFHLPSHSHVRLGPQIDNMPEPPPHPHLVTPMGITQMQDTSKFYVMHDYEYQSLKSLIAQFGKTSPKVARLYLKQIVCTVAHLHRHGLHHNRLNLDNILHDGQGKVLVSWLPTSKGPIAQPDKKRHFYYYPPQALLSRNYYDSAKNDVWAIGCIALQLQVQGSVRHSNFHPYNRKATGLMNQSSDILNKVQELMGNMGLNIPQENEGQDQKCMGVLGLEFVSLCLTVSIDRRASLAQLLHHPYLSV